MITDNYEDEPFIEKPKHRWLKILLLLIIIGGLAYGGYYYYVNYYNNPVQKINAVISNLKDKINERLKSTLSFDNKAFKVNGLVKININSTRDSISSELFNKIFNNLAIQINGEVDTRNNINNLDISSKLNNEKLIDGKIYMENNNIYVRSEELYEKFILLDDVKNEIRITDISKLYKPIISAFIKNLNTDNATKSDQIIKYNDNNIGVNDYKITFTNKELNQIAKDIYTDLKNNSEFINILKKFDDNALDKIEKELSFDNNISDEQNSLVIYEINFYTTKDIANEKLIKINQSCHIGNLNLKLDIDFIDEDTYLITLSINDQIDTIKLTLNNNIFSIDYNSETDDTIININANFNYEEISTVLKEDVSNSIKIRDIDLDDILKEKIMDKINNNTTLTEFVRNAINYMKNIRGDMDIDIDMDSDIDAETNN